MVINLTQISDEALATATKQAAQLERQATAALLSLLIEVERRGLQLALGYSSMFVYCTRALHFSEQAAYSRITAARAARRFPQLLELLNEGALTLSSVGLLAPHLTDETLEPLLDAARHKSTREVERLIAGVHSQPDIPTQVRALPARAIRPDDDGRSPLLGEAEAGGANTETAHPILAASRPLEKSSTVVRPSRPVVAPIAPSRFLLKLTISDDTHDKWQRARALLRHVIPDGDADKILNRALSLLLVDASRAKFAEARRPRQKTPPASTGRRIPAAVRRAVWQRDQGRCVFAGPNGQCGEMGFLEFHHVVPFAAGGASDESNLQLRCRAHNAYEAVVYFGAESASDRL